MIPPLSLFQQVELPANVAWRHMFAEVYFLPIATKIRANFSNICRGVLPDSVSILRIAAEKSFTLAMAISAMIMAVIANAPGPL